MTIAKAHKISEAHGAVCATCQQSWTLATNQYWHWSKSAAMHRSGTGHAVDLFRLVIA